jgi:succinate-acetate transporter protein
MDIGTRLTFPDDSFPFVVFTTFGGYWIAFAILNDPMIGVAAAFSATGSATEGSANPLFAEGVAVYLVIWGVLVFIYMIGSLRTNVVFVSYFPSTLVPLAGD